MKNKFLYLNDYVTTNNFDIIAICETWLGHADYDDTCINGLLPSDYNILRADRAEGRRGGGVALIYKQCLQIKCIERKVSRQFECIICSLTGNHTTLHIMVVYRPPPSQQNQLHTNEFLTEWTEFLAQHTTSVAELLIVGDLNIHLDKTTDKYTREMTNILDSYGLQQHIHEPTHYCGHTLDVLINRDTNASLSHIQVKDIGLCDNSGKLINSHYGITCDIVHNNSLRQRNLFHTVNIRTLTLHNLRLTFRDQLY